MFANLDNTFQKLLLSALNRFKLGRLQLTLPDGDMHQFGSGGHGPSAELVVNDQRFFRTCALHGNVGLGEAYVNEYWTTPDIRAVIEWFAINVPADETMRGSSQRIKMVGVLRWLDRLGHLLRTNSKTGSRRNIEEHYDLGNDFYQLWLDPSMTYSAARFTHPNDSLEEAQQNKYQALCEKLKLSENDHILEIGCGWGGFSIYAASRYGCRVTGVTISPAQHAEATRRVRERDLEHLIELRLQDYRDIEGQFDKIACIEMLEAVGDKYLETWCRKVDQVLKPNGMVAVQIITVPDADHDDLKRGTDFIQKHIFPGSLLLSVGRMNQAFNRTGDLFLHGLEDLGTCYRRTLDLWFDNFNDKLSEVRDLGFDDRFIRKWNYYLKYCEAGFATRMISVVQGVYTRPYNAEQLTSDGGVVSPNHPPDSAGSPLDDRDRSPAI